MNNNNTGSSTTIVVASGGNHNNAADDALSSSEPTTASTISNNDPSVSLSSDVVLALTSTTTTRRDIMDIEKKKEELVVFDVDVDDVVAERHDDDTVNVNRNNKDVLIVGSGVIINKPTEGGAVVSKSKDNDDDPAAVVEQHQAKEKIKKEDEKYAVFRKIEKAKTTSPGLTTTTKDSLTKKDVVATTKASNKNNSSDDDGIPKPPELNPAIGDDDMTAVLASNLRPDSLTQMQHYHRNSNPGAVAIRSSNSGTITARRSGTMTTQGQQQQQQQQEQDSDLTETDNLEERENEVDGVILVPEAALVSKTSETSNELLTDEMKERLRQEFLTEHTNNLLVAEPLDEENQNNFRKLKDEEALEEEELKNQRRKFYMFLGILIIFIGVISIAVAGEKNGRNNEKLAAGEEGGDELLPPTPSPTYGPTIGISDGFACITDNDNDDDDQHYNFVFNRFNGNDLVPDFYKYPREYYPNTPIAPTTIYPLVLPMKHMNDDASGNGGDDDDICFLRLTSEAETVPYDTVTSIMTSYQFKPSSSMTFTTSFAYRIYSSENTLHPKGQGMAFIIHQDQLSGGVHALGNPGHGYFGIYSNIWLDPTSRLKLVSPALIIELDTVEHTLANDQSNVGSSSGGNLHVQITSKEGDTISLFETPPNSVNVRTDMSATSVADVDDGAKQQHDEHVPNSQRYGRVWIEYTTDEKGDNPEEASQPAKPTLKIYINNKNEYKPSMPQVVIPSETLKLTTMFDPTQELYVGWTSSVNGQGARDNHDVLSWTGILEADIEGLENNSGKDKGDDEPVVEAKEDDTDTSVELSPQTGTTDDAIDDLLDTYETDINAYEYKYVQEMIAVDNIMTYGDRAEIFDPELGEYFAEGPDRLFDNTTSKFFYGWAHSPNDNIDNAIVLTPSSSSCTILQGITFYVANDIPERDWVDIRIEGRKTFKDTDFQLIRNVAFDLPDGRNQAFEDIDPTKHVHQTVMFEDNVEAYIQYRIIILKTKGSLASQVGELVLPGLLCPQSYISNDGNTNDDDNLGGSAGVEVTAGSTEGDDFISNTSLTDLNFTSNDGVWMFYDNLLSSNDRIETVGATTRFGRDTRNLVDGKTDKSILFPSSYHQDPIDPNIVSNFDCGFQIVPDRSTCTVVQGMTLFMSNHYIGRDPTSYTLEGRHVVYDVNSTKVQAISPYEVISEGSFLPPVERNKDSELIDLNKHSHVSITVNNTKPYTQYRVVFPRMRGFPIFYGSQQQGIEIQLAEIWFSGYTCPDSIPGSNSTTVTALPPPPRVNDSENNDLPSVLPPPFNNHTSSLNDWQWKESLLQFGDPIQQHGGGNAMGETAFEMYDGTTNKWLMIIHQGVVPGIEIMPTISPYTIVQGISFFPANDFPFRDPTYYTFEGRNLSDIESDGRSGDDDGYKLISEGPLSLPEKRNQQGKSIHDTTLHKLRVDFPTKNEVPYQQYRLLFHSNGSLNFPTEETFADSFYSLIIQVAEIQFHGYTLQV